MARRSLSSRMTPRTTINGRKVPLTSEIAQLIADEIVLASTGERVEATARANGAPLTPSAALDVVLNALDQGFGDRAKSAEWLVTPHPALSGQVPVDVISAGEHERVLALTPALNGVSPAP